MTLMVPLPYTECGILVTINDLWSPIPYMECWNIVAWSTIPYMKGGNIVTINNSYSSQYLIWNMGNLVPVNDSWTPIPYMESGNFVTVNGLWSPIFIQNMGTL